MLFLTPNAPTAVPHRDHFGGSAFALSHLGFDTKVTLYTGFLAVAVNLVVAVLGTLILRATSTPDGGDATREPDYFVDQGDERIEPGPMQYPEPATA
jgi:SSS family solute:Na+ symporter